MGIKINRQFLLVATVASGTILNPLNTTMISVAISRLQQEFNITFTDISWLISTYYLASAIGQPVMGKLSDIFGRKRIFLLGLLLVTVSSILAPLSPGFLWLIAFRMIQALGTSSMYPSGMGLIRTHITENQARALGTLSVFGSTSAALGPSIGGFLIHYGDWPMIFLINFPVILLSFILAIRVMPNDPKREKAKINIDKMGIVLFSAAIFLWLLFFLSLKDGISLWKLAAAILVTAVFYRYEANQSQPFVDVVFLRNNTRVTQVYLQFILINIIFYCIMFSMPTYLQNVKLLDSQHAGLVMLAFSCFGVIVTPLSARWMDRSGPKPALLAGNAMFITGSILLLTIHYNSSTGWISFVLGVLGLCNGMLNLGLQTSLFSNVAAKDTGIASGLFMTSRFTGTILSSSLIGIAFAHGMNDKQLHWMALACVAICVLLLILTLRMPQPLKTAKGQS
jgi:MFS family permease